MPSITVYSWPVRLLAYALLFGVAYAKPTHLAGRVISVHDGDTLRCETVVGNVSIRIRNIDAPELKQPGGIASRDYLRSYVKKGDSVDIDSYGRDKYGRVLGNVRASDGSDVATKQVMAGWAWAYRAYLDGPNWVTLEQQARTDKRGIWAGVPVPPWEFRK